MGNVPTKLDDGELQVRSYLEVSDEGLARGCSVAVSHHPADRATAIRLNNALSNAGRAVAVRWDEEEPDVTPDLLDRTHRAIEAHDCLVAVVSPAYLASELCRWELEHAVRCGKRIIPVEAQVIHDEAETLPPALRERNAVFLTPGADFDAGVRLLCKLMDRDRRHAREHTLILSRAVAWEAVHGRNRRLLLRGDDKRRALAFLDRAAAGTAPFPNSLSLDFLCATFARAQRSLRGGVLASRPPPAVSLQQACGAYTKAALRPPEGFASVFVSFAAEDADFARELVAAMAERCPERRILAHFEAREATKEQRDAVNADIQEAETFVFVISPDSLTSEASSWDLDHATQCAKRVVPVVARQVDLRTIPAELVDVKWIFFDGGLGSFEICVNAISQRCDRDLPHLQYHSRLLAYAVTWLQGGRAAKHLLRGTDVTSAVEWACASALGKGPFLTSLHREFLVACSGRASHWLVASVPEVAETASLPPDAQIPALCRKEWVLEVEASAAYMREESDAAVAAAAAAALAAAASDTGSEAEVSVFEPSSLESLPDAAGADGDDGDEAPSWAPVNRVKPLFDASGAERYTHDPENEEAFLDSLLEEDLAGRGDGDGDGDGEAQN